MLSHTINLICKIDPLKYLLSKTTLTGRMAKWVMLLSEFDTQYVDSKVIKGQVIVAQLAETPLVDTHPLIAKFLDEYVCIVATQTQWKLYFDGSHTKNGSEAGFLFVTPQGGLIPKSFKLSVPCTNNIVEYEGFIAGLKMAMQWNIAHILTYRDSQLVVK